MRLKKLALVIGTTLTLMGCNSDSDDISTISRDAQSIVQSMSIEEKVAQKLMMSFRYWCEDTNSSCTDGMTEINNTIHDVIQDNKLGGVILFANNQPDLRSTAKLVYDMQDAVQDDEKLGLFMALDQEGGNVVRLPRDQATNMPGNMALGAAYLATNDASLAYKEGQVLGAEVSSVGFNFNMAPVVDVQTNPLNPVINVRSYGENPELVGLLGGEVAKGMASEGVIGSMKHFPGHGDTATDSHYGLPIVNKSKEEAFAIDLAPYKEAIDQGIAPDMIMTAHIQYPSLDDTLVYTKDGEEMLVPATLSRVIQHDILRGDLNYQGLTITDALDMNGISGYFEETDAVIKVFQAGVDIALMPTQFRVADDAHQVEDLINAVADAVRSGDISEHDLDESVQRIVEVKLKRDILNHNSDTSLDDIYQNMDATIGSQEHRLIETEIAQNAITLVKNTDSSIPMSVNELGKIHMLTPWGEQGTAMRMTFEENGVAPESITNVKFSATDWNTEKTNIDHADTIIIGTLSSGISPVEIDGDPDAPVTRRFSQSLFTAPNNTGSLVFNVEEDNQLSPMVRSSEISDSQFARYALEYAKENGKKTILVSLRAPYDIASFDDVSDVALATYNYFGYDYGYLRGPSVIEIPNIIMGNIQAKGKLPVTIHRLDENGDLGDVAYEYGHSVE
ncbi:glycoside hydrolase family 3 protein [Vibrio sp. SS-MA-C1-2]|uniref:glycoside hydrolase family 3 protein n=1 Tax=Vibrio sp. SS-MA-C1-2 TaxID=2908646 RepID=UPI001F3E33D3|nr:glycoside hydrolase family 3 protein [Vibrio sp. SS-MA-C1-2]UJF18519.1 glycoside hydrolase family 3 protein [Vibrio sp. SS-MA-C1-2]